MCMFSTLFRFLLRKNEMNDCFSITIEHTGSKIENTKKKTRTSLDWRVTIRQHLQLKLFWQSTVTFNAVGDVGIMYHFLIMTTTRSAYVRSTQFGLEVLVHYMVILQHRPVAGLLTTTGMAATYLNHPARSATTDKENDFPTKLAHPGQLRMR